MPELWILNLTCKTCYSVTVFTLILKSGNFQPCWIIFKYVDKGRFENQIYTYIYLDHKIVTVCLTQTLKSKFWVLKDLYFYPSKIKGFTVSMSAKLSGTTRAVVMFIDTIPYTAV